MDAQSDGSYLIEASDKAISYADGDTGRLVNACFAGWLREMGVFFEWQINTDPAQAWFVIKSERYKVNTDVGHDPETLTIDLGNAAEWTVAARVISQTNSGALVELLGVTSQASSLPSPTPKHRLLKMSDWLAQFPHHQRPWQGLLDQERTTA